MRRSARALAALVPLLSLVAPACRPAGAGPSEGPPVSFAEAWKAVDRSIDDQQLEAAAGATEQLVVRAQASHDDANWAKALVRGTQLRIALGGYETAVEQLMARPWPTGALEHAAVELYGAHALLDYLEAYDWEIRQREQVASDERLDLKLWTAEQIATEAERRFDSVWQQREALGRVAIGDFPYLAANDYPPGIRDTLRDAVAYLFVDRLLGNTAFWSAREENEVWRLDLATLLADRPESPPGPVHPLLRAAAVLADLERWHAARKERAAEIEARLARVRLLAPHFDAASDREALRRDLETRLPRFRDVPWWSEGMAELAGLVDGGEAPDRRIAARELALAGERAYPGSHGGKRCRRLREEIEAPDVQVQGMNVDGPGRRSLEITHRNLAALHIRAYPVDLDARLRSAEFRGFFPNDPREIDRLLAGDPVAAWSVELPPTRDFLPHRTFATPPLTRPGLYLLVASADRSFREKGNRRLAVPFALSDLVLLEEGFGVPWQIRLLSGRTGEPAAGVEVELYRNNWRRAPERTGSVESDASGHAEIPPSFGGTSGQLLLVARRGDDLAFAQRYGGATRPEPRAATGALFFTDRAIYRPEQKLLWKVLAYHSGPERGRLRAAPQTPVTVWLADPNGERVAEATVTTNRFGTAAGELTIPAGRLLGAWSLQASLGGATPVRVEEYKRPTFEAEIAAPTEDLRLNRPARLAGEARYYFGLPVASGRVAWRVTREPQLPIWWRFWGPPIGAQPQQIASGTSVLDGEGKFTVEFTPEADEKEKGLGLTYLYRLAAEVTDAGGETRGAERTLRLGWTAIAAELERPRELPVEGEPVTVVARRRDLDGVARPGAGSWRLVALQIPDATPLPADLPRRPAAAPPEAGAEFATPGDRQLPRWERGGDVERTLAHLADGREVAQGVAEHGGDGSAALVLGALPSGAYRLRYATRDRFGESCETALDFLVAGAAKRLALPAALAFERAQAQPGDRVRLWLHSSLARAPVELELFRGAERFSRRNLELAGSQWLEIPVGEADRGGLSARLTLVADHQLVTATAALEVPWKNRELSVEVATFRDRLTPGARERFRVTVKDAAGRAVEAGAAELLASMYDRSLDLFAPFAPPRPLTLFPSGGAPAPLTTTLGTSGPIWWREESWIDWTEVESFRADAFVEISPYGIGGPGGRRFRGGAQRMMAKGTLVAESAMADGAPPPAPAAAPGPRGEPVDQAAVLEARAEAPPPVPLRSNFAETAFWQPQLLTGADGSATIEFTVPDSVTSWRFWVSALSDTLASGFAERQAESVKELMVRPYLPRFLREGDRAELQVVVNNASEQPLAGEVRLEILDPETNASLLGEFGLTAESARRAFEVAPGKGSDLTFPIAAPRRVGATAFQVTAVSGAISDGELRPLPLLPSRLHLAQSRFVALKDRERREMTFEEMRQEDPTRIDEQLVVTVDGQLFYSMLDALPYLVEYPYECTEQTMNRFVSTGMLASLFAQYPAVGRMAEEMAKRETPYERFDAAEPNRRMALEETPWLRESRGGEADPERLLRVLDPQIARAQRDEALAKLGKAQLPSGGFPWFAGGPPSPYITLYLMAGLARAAEFGVDVPKEMVQRGWGYLAREATSDWLPRAVKDDCCWELLTFLNYVASSYPDPTWTADLLSAADRRRILDFSFAHWKRHTPLSKLQLAMTLARMERPKDAQLVLASVMDSARATRDEGTFWQSEDRAWLWYADRIETHAWALRALLEIAPGDPRAEGLVQWLFLNKKLNHWKSTRATAEVLYSLAWYLKREQLLGAREEIAVTAGNARTTLLFEPDRFTGKKNQIVVPGAKLDAVHRPADATVVVEKATRGLAFASATWHFSTELLPAEARGDLFRVERRYFKRTTQGEEATLQPLAAGARLAVGDEVEVQLSLSAKAPAEYVHLRDPRPAGLEPDRAESGWRWDLGLARYEETRDSGANFFFERLPAGEYTMKYRLRANLAGEFRAAPAELQSLYAPEFVAYSAGERLAIAPAE